ncbi:MAG: hypothetical protein JXA25_05345 [Anaerolineales bacterium]|nr:hypothetical protein [Anaerolineales bacterium]
MVEITLSQNGVPWLIPEAWLQGGTVKQSLYPLAGFGASAATISYVRRLDDRFCPAGLSYAL